jgi:hypothetical protein
MGISSLGVSHLSQQQINESQCLIARNVHPGETHDMQSEKFEVKGVWGSNSPRSDTIDSALCEFCVAVYARPRKVTSEVRLHQ